MEATRAEIRKAWCWKSQIRNGGDGSDCWTHATVDSLPQWIWNVQHCVLLMLPLEDLLNLYPKQALLLVHSELVLFQLCLDVTCTISNLF